ncbi:MAG: hypothetical protein KBC48_02350 [Candidatus Pacebacteria bacterium]|nr:hypothetical protein [Candidatus Paceibacterota bacterium]
MEIVPAIISNTFAEVEDKLNLLEPLVDWAHVDVMDGSMTSTKSWRVPSDLDFVNGKIKLEVHLMIKDVEEVLAEWASVTDRLIIHAESVADLGEVIEVFKNHHSKLGVALLLDTPLAEITSVLPEIDFVHLMSVREIGYHGKKFEEEVLEKIKSLRALSSSVTISVDGGITLDNKEKIISAGANRLVVGQALWSTPDLAATINAFRRS